MEINKTIELELFLSFSDRDFTQCLDVSSFFIPRPAVESARKRMRGMIRR